MTLPGRAELPAGDAAMDAAGDAARVRVLAAVVDAAARSTLRPPALLTARPMRPLEGPLAAKLAARSAAGLDLTGLDLARTDPPRGRRLSARNLPRLSRAERRAVQSSRTWESRQPWIGGMSAGRERALVTVAADTVARICSTAAWESPHLEGHRHRLDLAAELDQIDARAFSLAAAHTQVERAWPAIVDRVAALDVYAAHLASLDRGLAGLDHTLLADAQAAELSLGTARDVHATDLITALVEDLGGLAAAVTEVDRTRPV